MHCGSQGPSLLRGSESPLQQIANGCNFGVLRRQKRPIYWRCVYYSWPRTMLLGSVDVVQLQQWSEQHCFGAALWFLRLLPSHLYCLCYRTCISEAPGRPVESASDLDIPGTMSLESVGVLKLQACRPTHLQDLLQQNANGCTVGVLRRQERPKHWRCLW
jgi:hypothetical protein